MFDTAAPVDGVVIDPPIVTCGNCSHAALHSGGVYCMEFNEVILNESVAEECGSYRTDVSTLALVQPPFVSTEEERLYVGHIEIPFFGKEKVRDDIHRRLVREINLMFNAATVKSIE